jgi:hypothetical protein
MHGLMPHGTGREVTGATFASADAGAIREPGNPFPLQPLRYYSCKPLRGHCFPGGHRKLSTQFACRAEVPVDRIATPAIFPATAGSVRLGSPARKPRSRDFMRFG